MATVSKEQIKQAINQGKDIIKKINEQIPVPIKKIGNKTAYYASIRNQKIIFVYVMLKVNTSNKSYSEAFSDVNGKNYNDIVKLVKHEIGNDKLKKINVALYLVISDILQQFFIAAPSAHVLKNSLGAILYKIVDKTINIFRKKQPDVPDTKTILDKIKQKTLTMLKKEKELGISVKIILPDNIQELYNYILVASALGGYIEEVSKSIAHDLKISKQYLSIFLIIENFIYASRLTTVGFSMKQIIKMRTPSIIMHIAMALLHHIPKLRKYTYLIHPLFNIIALVIESQQHKQKYI